MNKILLIILGILGVVNTETPLCGTGWEPYENEKCLKVFENAGLITYESAEGYCSQQENASLILIHSLEEQNFITNFLIKTNNIVDSVWIGAKNSSITSKFRWTDNSELTYTNWADGNPTNKTYYDCVQLMPDSSPSGKWMNEPCTKKNAVVCQKFQVWSLEVIQKNLQENNRLLKSMAQLNVAIPVGFIYVQLPKQPEPKELWPDLKWQNISSEYSGHFFRVEGGNSAEFGTSQLDAFQGHEHESPSTIFNQTSYGAYDPGSSPNTYYTRLGIKLSSGMHDHTLSSTGFNGTPRNASETRPINYSVRVWKRIS